MQYAALWPGRVCKLLLCQQENWLPPLLTLSSLWGQTSLNLNAMWPQPQHRLDHSALCLLRMLSCNGPYLGKNAMIEKICSRAEMMITEFCSWDLKLFLDPIGPTIMAVCLLDWRTLAWQMMVPDKNIRTGIPWYHPSPLQTPAAVIYQLQPTVPSCPEHIHQIWKTPVWPLSGFIFNALHKLFTLSLKSLV